MRRSRTAMLLCLSGGLASAILVHAQGTEKKAVAKTDATPVAAHHDWGTPESGSRKVIGVVESCYRCHNIKEGAESEDLPPGFEDDGWVLLNELRTWVNQDRKHYQAYAVLLNDQSKQIARLMGIVDPITKEPIAHRDARCLACHSAVPVHQFQWDAQVESVPVVATDTAIDKRFNLGVSCEACHGPSGSNGKNKRGWGNAHWMKEDTGEGDADLSAENDDSGSRNDLWRTWDPKKKFDEFGFWNVRSPITQTKVCLSCHLGNVEQGKVITHSMYAAGHPPLPSFELTAFIAQEPRHWRMLSEKSPEIQKSYCEAGGYGCGESELRTSRSTLVAALVAAGEAARLTADLIDPDSKSPAEQLEKPHWPELANFACYACHHDLQRDGWRQSRPRTGAPGRPLLHEWPVELAKIAAATLNVESEYDELHAALNATVLGQPFGRTTDLLTASRQFADRMDELALTLSEKPMSVAEGKLALKRIATTGAEKPMDYDAARQLLWAYSSIHAEIHKISNRSQKPLEPTPDDLLGVESNAGVSIKFETSELGWMKQKTLTAEEQILKQLEESLTLDLRVGDTSRKQQFKGERAARPKVEVDLGKTLPKIANYDPAVVQAAFQKLLEAGGK